MQKHAPASSLSLGLLSPLCLHFPTAVRKTKKNQKRFKAQKKRKSQICFEGLPLQTIRKLLADVCGRTFAEVRAQFAPKCLFKYIFLHLEFMGKMSGNY